MGKVSDDANAQNSGATKAPEGAVAKGKERKGYFYEREEQAVVDYLNTDDEAKRGAIYNEILHPAFTKMIESIIRRYKLFIPDEEYQDTFDDTMSYLVTKLSYFDPSRNFKAYSYCGTICKNYLIHKITQFTKRQNRSVSYDNPLDTLQDSIKDSIRYSYVNDYNPMEIVYEITSSTVDTIEKMIASGETELGRPLTDNEVKVGKAIISLFKNSEELFMELGSNKFNKSSIAYYIREATTLSQKEVAKAMKIYKVLYKDMKKSLLE